VFHAFTSAQQNAENAERSSRYFVRIKALVEMSGARNVYQRCATQIRLPKRTKGVGSDPNQD
jgi:hypothetical protein